MEYCYLTRDTGNIDVDVWPAAVGIRKFHGCVQYGAGWSENIRSPFLYKSSRSDKLSYFLNPSDCRKRFGFYPRAGQAWDIDDKKRTRIDQNMLFSP